MLPNTPKRGGWIKFIDKDHDSISPHLSSSLCLSAARVCVCVCVCAQSLSCIRLFATLWTVACQAPLSIGFPRQGYWSRLPFPSPGDLPDPGIEPTSTGLGGSPGVRNGNLLQYPCLGNSMDRGAWQTAVHGVPEWDTAEHALMPTVSHCVCIWLIHSSLDGRLSCNSCCLGACSARCFCLHHHMAFSPIFSAELARGVLLSGLRPDTRLGQDADLALSAFKALTPPVQPYSEGV